METSTWTTQLTWVVPELLQLDLAYGMVSRMEWQDDSATPEQTWIGYVGMAVVVVGASAECWLDAVVMLVQHATSASDWMDHPHCFDGTEVWAHVVCDLDSHNSC